MSSSHHAEFSLDAQVPGDFLVEVPLHLDADEDVLLETPEPWEVVSGQVAPDLEIDCSVTQNASEEGENGKVGREVVAFLLVQDWDKEGDCE